MNKIEKQNKFSNRRFVDSPEDKTAHDDRLPSVKERVKKRREEAEKFLNRHEFRAR